jgi:DNA polymerase-3 subunit delta
MPLAAETQVLAALQAQRVAPVYLLVGDDEQGKRPLLDALAALVPADLQAFNVQRCYANERSLAEIVSAARTLPLLGDRRLVFVSRCEVFLKLRRKGAAGSDSEPVPPEEPDTDAPAATADLERYLTAPVAETCLVLVAADMTRNTRLVNQLVKTAVVVEYWGLKNDREAKGRDLEQALNAAERLVRQAVRDAGMRISSEAILPLLEHAGTDISVLRGDVDRLLTFCAGKREIVVDDVRAVIGGAVQIDGWALTSAIENGDVREALRQITLGMNAGASEFMTLGQLAWFVRTRLAQKAPARVPRAMEALFRTDTALKSSGGDPDVLLERLVVELCETGRRR